MLSDVTIDVSKLREIKEKLITNEPDKSDAIKYAFDFVLKKGIVHSNDSSFLEYMIKTIAGTYKC